MSYTVIYGYRIYANVQSNYLLPQAYLKLCLRKKEDKEKFEKIRARYKKVTKEHGAEIKGVNYITRYEPFRRFTKMQIFQSRL